MIKPRPSSVISEGFAVAHIKTSGRRLNAKAVISAMPVARPKARITGIMDVPLF
jgi:hypothetical protein